MLILSLFSLHFYIVYCILFIEYRLKINITPFGENVSVNWDKIWNLESYFFF